MANPQAQNPKYKQDPTTIKPKSTAKAVQRSYTKTNEFTTDVFKLMQADVIKHDSGATENAHPNVHTNEFTRWPHAHPFRTYDKGGKRLDLSTPIGGHFHVIEWQASEVEGESPEILSVSPPMVMGSRLNPETGLKEKVPVPANIYDKHTHDIQYIQSTKIVVSKANTEAMAVISMVESKTAALSGVVER